MRYDLGESLELLAALEEDTQDTLADTDHLAVVALLDRRSRGSAVSWVWNIHLEVGMATELLRGPEAPQRLGVPTKELLRLVPEPQIRYVMVDGIAHIPDDAFQDTRRPPEVTGLAGSTALITPR